MEILLNFKVLFVEAMILQQLLKEVSCNTQDAFPTEIRYSLTATDFFFCDIHIFSVLFLRATDIMINFYKISAIY